MTPAAGPFETETQARRLPAVRAVYDAMHVSHPSAPAGGCELLGAACDGAGVQLGAYGRRILDCLTGYEPQMIAGTITAPHASPRPPLRSRPCWVLGKLGERPLLTATV